MVEPPADDGTLSPEDLKRLGLAGQGDTRFLRRIGEDLSSFRRALRPSWRGLFGTIGLAMLLAWVGKALPLALVDWSIFLEFGAPPTHEFDELVEKLLSAKIWLDDVDSELDAAATPCGMPCVTSAAPLPSGS